MDAGPTGIFLPELIEPQRTIGSRTFDFSRQVVVMAVVNRTPDSFYDVGRTYELSKAVDAVRRAEEAGADWVDIGGVPFGTAGAPVSAAEELDRVIPVVAAVRQSTDVVLSVDTYRTEVARAAIEAGADVINDTSGLREEGMAELIARSGVSVVITHSLASPPRTPVPSPQYRDVAAEVADFLVRRTELARSRGVAARQIIIDPGHDLNKNTHHTLELTRRLADVTALGYPTLAAVSNKDFIGEALGAPQGQRLEGTLAAVVFCVLLGARIVRVHDIPQAVAATRTIEAILGWRPPAYTRHNL